MSDYNFFVPVEMCGYALSNKFINPLRLYIYLKGSCQGQIKLGKEDVKIIATELECDPKSIKNNLAKLLKANWIGYNPKSSYYFIRGFEKVRGLHWFDSRSSAEFQKSYLNNFKAFAAGACVGYLANYLRRGAVERNKGRSNHAAPNSEGFPVSSRLIAKLLNVSLGAAHKIKKDAQQGNFIKVKKNFKHTGCSYFEKRSYERTFPETVGRLRNSKGHLVVVDSDLILSVIRFKRRKKSERCIRGY